MLRLMFCFSCCQNPDSPYKRSIRNKVNKRNEKLTEVANFDDIIANVNNDLKAIENVRKISHSSSKNIQDQRSNKDADIPIGIEGNAEDKAGDGHSSDRGHRSDGDLNGLNAILQSIDNDYDNVDKIKTYARLDYSPLPDSADEGDNMGTSSVLSAPPSTHSMEQIDRANRKQCSTKEETTRSQLVAVPIQQVGMLARQQSTEQRSNSSDVLSGATYSESSSSLMSLNSQFSSIPSSIPSSIGGRLSRTSWDTVTAPSTIGDNFEFDLLEDKDDINYDHEFICSRLDEIFNKQMSLLNIDSSQLAYENIAIIIAYDKTDPTNNNRLICFASTSKALGIRLDDLNVTSLVDMRAATMARRALLLYLYKEIEIINANSEASGKVLSHDAYLLERAYDSRRPAGYRIKNKIGLSMYLNRIEATPSQSHQSRPSSRASIGTGSLAREQIELMANKDDQHPMSHILRLKSIDHKISLWNVLGLQGSLLGMMIEPIYLDHITLGQVNDLKRLKTLQAKSAKSSLSAHANKPYRLASPRLRLWRDDCQAVYKNIKFSVPPVADHNKDDLTIGVNLLNWTYYDDAAELVEINTGTVRSPYLSIGASEGERSTTELDPVPVSSRMCKAKMLIRLMKIISRAHSTCFLSEGHNGGKYFSKIQAGWRINYRSLKNLAYQYNYVKYLCSPIFMNDLRVAAGGIDWVTSYDKVKNYEDQISCTMPLSSGYFIGSATDEEAHLFEQQRVNANASSDDESKKSLFKLSADEDHHMNDDESMLAAESSSLIVGPHDVMLTSDQVEQKHLHQHTTTVKGNNSVTNDTWDKPPRSSDSLLCHLSAPSSTLSQLPPIAPPTPTRPKRSATPTPSEASGTKSKSRAKALLKRWGPGKKKKKLDNSM